jgi:phage shock protein PspC (stress-responsive transcriptional regulator)
MAIANDLERLAELHRSGAISDAEFARAKARALDETPQAAKNAVTHWLHALRRSRTDSWLGGVCGGLAPAIGVPSWLVRLVFGLLVVCGGTGLLLYVLLWILLPRDEGAIELGQASLHSG